MAAPKRSTDLSRAFLLTPPLDVTLVGPVPLGRMRSFLVPDEPGVYLIHDLRGALYAGRTIRLRRRFGEHCDARGNELIDLARRSAFGVVAFSWAVVRDGPHRARLERALVEWLRPACNRTTPDAPA